MTQIIASLAALSLFTLSGTAQGTVDLSPDRDVNTLAISFGVSTPAERNRLANEVIALRTEFGTSMSTAEIQELLAGKFSGNGVSSSRNKPPAARLSTFSRGDTSQHQEAKLKPIPVPAKTSLPIAVVSKTIPAKKRTSPLSSKQQDCRVIASKMRSVSRSFVARDQRENPRAQWLVAGYVAAQTGEGLDAEVSLSERTWGLGVFLGAARDPKPRWLSDAFNLRPRVRPMSMRFGLDWGTEFSPLLSVNRRTQSAWKGLIAPSVRLSFSNGLTITPRLALGIEKWDCCKASRQNLVPGVRSEVYVSSRLQVYDARGSLALRNTTENGEYTSVTGNRDYALSSYVDFGVAVTGFINPGRLWLDSARLQVGTDLVGVRLNKGYASLTVGHLPRPDATTIGVGIAIPLD